MAGGRGGTEGREEAEEEVGEDRGGRDDEDGEEEEGMEGTAVEVEGRTALRSMAAAEESESRGSWIDRDIASTLALQAKRPASEGDLEGTLGGESHVNASPRERGGAELSRRVSEVVSRWSRSRCGRDSTVSVEQPLVEGMRR